MEKPMINVPVHWWRSFFSDVIVDMWLQAVPAEGTLREAAFIQTMLKVAPPGRLLDCPCGGGRHSLPLAAAGYQMTGVDISRDFLTAARTRAAEQKLAVTWVERGMRDIPWHEEFDGAFCFGNSFGYDDDEGNAAFLKAVGRSIKPGARFLLDYPMVLEARLPRFQARNWSRLGDIYFLEDEHYDHTSGRIVTDYTFIREGTVVTRPASHRAYTFREIYGMLADAGFVDVQAFGSLSSEPFQLGSDGLFLLATKPAV
jgi:SAM-dependent methyltransferase